MKFRTEIEIKPFGERIDYRDTILLMGSCFADEIGARLVSAKFRATVNPTGVLFNPISICQTIERFANNRHITPAELHEGAQGWYHFDLHSSLSSPDKEQTLHSMNCAIERGNAALRNSDWVILTLGTSWVYELRQTREVVASCHKQPHSIFERKRLSINEIVNTLSRTIEQYLTSKKIILTLSPIRHIGDGLSENSLSKATLRVAIEELTAKYPAQVAYFPAYETLIDDLRDYRFYGQDMTHPSPMAVDYVWQKFTTTALSTDAISLLPKVERIMRAVNHRPTAPQSNSHKQFCAEQLHAISQLEEIVDLTCERLYFESF